ncbi:hypothetical protein T09_12395 [Trichinella sp. T9]|nr:hypothetical protein T09_12395 [Trichinella sp. T9]
MSRANVYHIPCKEFDMFFDKHDSVFLDVHEHFAVSCKQVIRMFSRSSRNTSGSGRTTICLTFRPDFVCRKTVSKYIPLPSWKISADLLYDWYHMKCEKEALGLEIALKKASSLSSIESWDRWDKRSNSSSETVSGSDKSGSGRTTICLTFRPDFVCRKTVSKYIIFRAAQGKQSSERFYPKPTTKTSATSGKLRKIPLMADVSELRLVKNRYGGLSLVYEGRAYKLKHTGKQKKYWGCSKARAECAASDKQGCKGAMWTNLEVTAVISQKDHMENCPMDEHLAYKMEKKAILKKRSAEETTPISTIYDQEASAASADSATSGQFPIFKRVKSAMYLNRAKCVVKTPKPI